MKTILIKHKARKSLRILVDAWRKENKEKAIVVNEVYFFDTIDETHKQQINFYI